MDVTPKIIFDVANLNIRVEDSYKITSKKEVRKWIWEIMESPEFSELETMGFNRSENSMVNEWLAHNFLYYIGYKRDRTGSVDINQSEPMWRKVVYWLLAQFKVISKESREE